MCRTLHGFSNIGIPMGRPGPDSPDETTSIWVDDKVQRDSDVAASVREGVHQGGTSAGSYDAQVIHVCLSLVSFYYSSLNILL